MRILLIRHGQDERGYRGGWSQRGLTAEGRAQSQKLALSLRARRPPLIMLISSDLARAAETTAYIVRELAIPVQYIPAWREMNNGELAGMPDGLAEQCYPGLYAASLAMDVAYPGGESPRAFFQRIVHTFEDLCEAMLARQLPPDIAIITHAGPINIIYYLLKGLVWSNKQSAFPAAATGIHELSCIDGKWQIAVENNIKHL